MDIFIVDDQPPEASAMLQALYSRSSKSARDHLKQVQERGSAKFMASYYVGYGHSSIGDCGSTTIFIENVSIIAAKAIQDNPLYSGQETSTRYIDFTKQNLTSPIDSDHARSIHSDLMAFYVNAQDSLLEHLSLIHRPLNDQNSGVYTKALNARKFDILRAFLPAGVQTQLSWSTNLRQAADHVNRLASHPLLEIREIGMGVFDQLSQRYPSSFSRNPDAKDNQFVISNGFSYHYPTFEFQPTKSFVGDLIYLNKERLQVFGHLLRNRPKYSVLPRECARIARFRFRFPLDYGSYRDIQRHRNGFCPNPILNTQLGFEPWYLEQLPEDIKKQANELLHSVEARLEELSDGSPARSAELQYYVPMGYKVSCDLEYDLNESIYVSELRSGRTVHPTLRKVANSMAEIVQVSIDSLALYNDCSMDEISMKRGTQDIVKKDSEIG
jgi:thymidylate synthase ThyX